MNTFIAASQVGFERDLACVHIEWTLSGLTREGCIGGCIGGSSLKCCAKGEVDGVGGPGSRIGIDESGSTSNNYVYQTRWIMMIQV